MLSRSDVSQAEGNAGPTSFDFTVSLSNASSQTITVNYQNTDRRHTTTHGNYVAATRTATFTPSQTSQTVTVTVNGDTKFEPDETFFVNPSGAAHATIAESQRVGTSPTLFPYTTLFRSDVSQAEGNAGPTSFDFTVSLSNASSQTITVNYQ